MSTVTQPTPPFALGEDLDTVVDSAVGRMRPGWVVLRDCVLFDDDARHPPRRLRYALLHPSVGVALLDVGSDRTPDAVARLRRRLDAAGFPTAFPGYLPMVYRSLPADDLRRLGDVLDRAFTSQRAIDQPGGATWMVLVWQALTSEPPKAVAPNRALSALVGFWALVLLVLGGGAAVLQYLGPLDGPVQVSTRDHAAGAREEAAAPAVAALGAGGPADLQPHHASSPHVALSAMPSTAGVRWPSASPSVPVTDPEPAEPASSTQVPTSSGRVRPEAPIAAEVLAHVPPGSGALRRDPDAAVTAAAGGEAGRDPGPEAPSTLPDGAAKPGPVLAEAAATLPAAAAPEPQPMAVLSLDEPATAAALDAGGPTAAAGCMTEAGAARAACIDQPSSAPTRSDADPETTARRLLEAVVPPALAGPGVPPPRPVWAGMDQPSPAGGADPVAAGRVEVLHALPGEHDRGDLDGAAPLAGAAATLPEPVRPAARATSGSGVTMVLATNVRSGPDGTAPVLRTVSAGTRLRVFTRLGSWLRVGDAEPWGWVHVSRTEDLVGTPSSGPPPATSTHTVAEPPRMPRNSEPASDAFTGHSGVVLLGANVRADPSADAPVLRTIGSGVYARVFARYGGWLQVGDSEPWGWVHVTRTKGLVDPLSLPAPPLAADGAQSEPLFPGKNAVPSEY